MRTVTAPLSLPWIGSHPVISAGGLTATPNASKQAAEELRAQIEADTQMAEELSAGLEEIGVTAAVAALQSRKN
ncbi:hypothetical protein GCM10029992_12810 [Glycomyces albus]